MTDCLKLDAETRTSGKPEDGSQTVLLHTINGRASGQWVHVVLPNPS